MAEAKNVFFIYILIYSTILLAYISTFLEGMVSSEAWLVLDLDPLKCYFWLHFSPVFCWFSPVYGDVIMR